MGPPSGVALAGRTGPPKGGTRSPNADFLLLTAAASKGFSFIVFPHRPGPVSDARSARPGRRLSRRPRRKRVRPAGRTVARRVAKRTRRAPPRAPPRPKVPRTLPVALPPPPEVALLPAPAIELPPPQRPAPHPLPELGPADRFIAWTFILGGFGGVALLVGTAWALESEVAPADLWMRRGLALGSAAALVIQMLGLAGGIGRITGQAWARATLRLAALFGVILATAAFTVLLTGPVLSDDLLLPSGLTAAALVADAAAAVFFGWATVRLGTAGTSGAPKEAPPPWTPPAT